MRIGDQVAHFVIAFLVVSMVLAYPGIVSGGAAGFAMGLIREVTEDGPVNSPGSLLDLVFWTLGGVVAGVAFVA